MNFKDLENLITTYLEPLQVQTFLPPGDISRLAASCASILRFHQNFLIEIEQGSSTSSPLCDKQTGVKDSAQPPTTEVIIQNDMSILS